jgi:methylenetetrahydrofolate dehydrogenase (NADP+)/methenyltetrahydrofolate cyclohydrolase
MSDGLHPWNIGMMLRQGPCFLPATPYGIVELLLRGEFRSRRRVTIVGFGELVGAPLSVRTYAGFDPRERHRHVDPHPHQGPAGAYARGRHRPSLLRAYPHLITAEMVKPVRRSSTSACTGRRRALIGDVKFDECAEVAGASRRCRAAWVP